MPIKWFPIEIIHPLTGEKIVGRGYYSSPQSCPTERFQHVKALYTKQRIAAAPYENMVDPTPEKLEAAQHVTYEFAKRLTEICVEGIDHDLFLAAVTESELYEYCHRIQSEFMEVDPAKKAEPQATDSGSSSLPGSAMPGSDPVPI